MRRKRNNWYEITIDGPCIHNSEYWYGGGKWFIPQYNEDGRGINNPSRNNYQRCNTKAGAVKAANKLFNLVNKPVRITQIFRKNGEMWEINYIKR